MSWIGPCWLLKIVPWYFLKGKTPHHMHKKSNMPYTTTYLYHPPTFPIEAKQCGRKVYIILSGYWGGGSLHTTVNRTYNMHDAHITNETERFFSWLHTTIILTPTIGGRIAIHEKNIYHIEWALRKWLACYLCGPNVYRCTVSQM